MATVLHLFKGGDAALALATIEAQRDAGDAVTVALLHDATMAALPDGIRVHHVPSDLPYDKLLDLIFASDSVVTW